MQIDPVVALTEKLSQAEKALREARLRSDDKMVSRWLALISLLNEELYGTVPTSALGAAELIRRAAGSLGASQTGYATHMMAIADRLSKRLARAHRSRLAALDPPGADPRAMRQRGCDRGAAGVSSPSAARSRPVVVFRAVLPPRDDDSWVGALSRSP